MSPQETRMRRTLALTISVLVTGLILAGNTSAWAWRVKLGRSGSFVGWDYGPSLEGWRLEDEKFVAEAPAPILLSGWTFGEFDLQLLWLLKPGATAAVIFPEVPSGPELRLTLSTDERCGHLVYGDQELASGQNVGIRPNRPYRLRIVRKENKLEVVINNQRLYEVEFPPEKRLGLAVMPQQGEVAFWGFEVEEPRGTPMFNGQDFSGWYTRGDIRRWRYERGEVVLAGRAGDYLRTEKSYGNFVWYLEFQMQKGGNSGLGLRTPHDGWPTADGMELQLLDTPYEAKTQDQPMMAVYGHVPPLGRADRSQQWNQVVVKVEGHVISAWMNGQLVQHVNTFHHPELRHRPLEGWLGFQDHGAWIRVRNVTILELPSGKGLEAWYRPRPLPPVAEVLDRLINPVRLALPTATTSRRYFAAVVPEPQVVSQQPEAASGVEGGTSEAQTPASPKEVTLVDIVGPGAVTGITHFGGNAKLRFYFDGETQPRIETTLAEWHTKLPAIGKDRNPFLTCLPFARRLRIEAVDAAPCRFYFDVVQFPGGAEVESFRDVETSFPRGWYDCVNAILRWLGSGRYQEFSPYERINAQPTAIGPGETKKLLAVEGSGIIRSWKLQVPRRVLENNDLWVQIFTDGQKTAAVEAPVRFLFPALTRNYENYVFADQRGLTLFLAMPFVKGWELVVVNKGGRTLNDVAVIATVDRAPLEDVQTAWRLRGRFLPAASGGELLRLSGAGRLVGVVYEVPVQGDAGIFSVIVDQRPVDGWACDTLEAVLGRSGNFRGLLSGREGPLCWRFFHLSPLEWRESVVVSGGSDQVGARLVWYYAPN